LRFAANDCRSIFSHFLESAVDLIFLFVATLGKQGIFSP